MRSASKLRIKDGPGLIPGTVISNDVNFYTN